MLDQKSSLARSIVARLGRTVESMTRPAPWLESLSKKSWHGAAGFFQRAISRLARGSAIFLILCYRGMIRPFLIGTCKFHPTCSEYALAVIQTHGLFRGGRLALKRLLRCVPFTPGGVDLPPPGPGPGHPDAFRASDDHRDLG